MQVTETLSQGLKREYDIFLPASDLAEKLNGQLAQLKTKAQIKGFRPGKVPVEHLRKVYGKSVMADVVQEAITQRQQADRRRQQLRLAREPKVELPTDQSAIDAALEARGDLTFKIALEVLPKFEIGDFSEISLERLTAEVEEADVATALERLADSRRNFIEKPEGAKAESRRPRHHRLRRQDRRRAVRRRRGARYRGDPRFEHLHSRIRGPSSSASSPARSA